MTTLARRRGYVIAGQRPQEEVRTGHEGLVEDDGTHTCHRSDEDTEGQPLLEVGRMAQPTGCSRHGGPPGGSTESGHLTEFPSTDPSRSTSPARALRPQRQ